MSTRKKKLLAFSAGILFIATGFYLYYKNVLLIEEPVVSDKSVYSQNPVKINEHYRRLGENWLVRSPSGLWEMYLEGSPFERGVVNGKLSQELVYRQEKIFSEHFNELVPNSFYRQLLKYGIAWFMKSLPDHVTIEQQQEIYGVSLSASPDFNFVAPPYQRLLNYHAAHDIGHAVQNMALVGCSGFATWGDRSENSDLILARNFDFHVNDAFAEEKIVLFQKPDKGIPFGMVTWGGMTGVVSGMNLEGLSVTLNAAPSAVPRSCATPVSLIAREILQYAKNIDEARSIAASRKPFVSELLLIGSKQDNKAVVFELTPDTLSIYDPGGSQLVCTNHFNSKENKESAINKKQGEESSSNYRFETLKGIFDTLQKNNTAISASILRRQTGLHGAVLGNGNEMAINQLISHHSVIFNLHKGIMWVSEGPWQIGAFSGYDLNKIFGNGNIKNLPGISVSEPALRIPADTFLMSDGFRDFKRYLVFQNKIETGEDVDLIDLKNSNPEYYKTYFLAGEQLLRNGEYAKAESEYAKSLLMPVPNKKVEKMIRERIEKCRNLK